MGINSLINESAEFITGLMTDQIYYQNLIIKKLKLLGFYDFQILDYKAENLKKLKAKSDEETIKLPLMKLERDKIRYYFYPKLDEYVNEILENSEED